MSPPGLLSEDSPDCSSNHAGATVPKANGKQANGRNVGDNGLVKACNDDVKAGNGNIDPSKGHGDVQVCFPGGVEKWEAAVREIAERCDLSGIATDSTKYQLAVTGFSDGTDGYNEYSIPLPAEVLVALEEMCLARGISVRSVVLFAVHHMLKGFGGGSHTVTASIDVCGGPNDIETSYTISPSVVCHENKQGWTVMQDVESIEKMDRLRKQEMHPVKVGSCLIKMGLLDIPVIFADANEFQGPFADFPVAVVVREGGGRLQVALFSSESLFDRKTIVDLAEALNVLLAEAASGGTTPVLDLELLSAEQKQQLEEWNRTDGEYPKCKRLHHLIEEATQLHEEKVAVVYKGRQLTYGELNAQANRFAHYLRSIGILREQLVALFLEKTENLIVTILGIWKSGAAYVPIDPTYPDERVRFVLDDTKATVIIASNHLAERLQREIVGDRDLCIIHLEPCLSFIAQQPSTFPSDNLRDPYLNSKQLAYVTYTSGTTGFPKGIFKQHTNVVNSITDLSTRYGVTGDHHEAILLFSAYVFEPFVRQMLMALVNGHLLAMVDDAEKYDAEKLIPFICEHKITYLNGTASVLQEYDFSSCPSLKRMILVGENLTEARYLALRRRFKNRILSEYGFTESAFVTALKVFGPGSARNNTSLGRPVRNVKCYILNHSLKRVPIGATGELHIGGLGISKGYLNRPDLTPQRFIPNPFRTDLEKELGINELMYKTGDLARWLPNGEIEYLGRADFLIKLRGIRIEPGEIESTLAGYPGVRTSLVVSKRLRHGERETTNEHLVGYYVCDATSVSETDLLQFLELKLPRYMIPTRLVQLSQIPVTVNGKADLRALPPVDVVEPKESSCDLSGEMEIALGKIWADVLGAHHLSISRKANFFRLGGHSITCIQLIARIRQQLGVTISIEDVFSFRTLEQMAEFLRNKESSEIPREEARPQSMTVAGGVANGNAYLASSLQQGFVYQFLKNMGRSGAYVMQSVLRYNVKIHPDLFQRGWKHVQHVFPALRLRFQWGQDVLQVIDEDQQLNWSSLSSTDGPALPEEQKLLDLQRRDLAEPYDLATGSLFRVYLIEHSSTRFSCLFSCHHAILDGWSLPLLFEKVHETYLHLLHGDPLIRSLEDPYSQSQEYLQAHREDHLRYWASIVEQIDERCDMNALLNERSRYKIQLADYDQVEDQHQLTLTVPDVAWLAELRQICSAHGITLHSILQFVWHAVLHAYGGGTHTITGTTISGRNLPLAYRNKTIMEAIHDVQAAVNGMNSRGNVELGRLHKSELKHGLFDSLFVLENYPNLDKSQEMRQKSELQYTIQGSIEKLDYPLAVIAREIDGTKGFTFTICYARELFDEIVISELLQMVQDTLLQVAKHLGDPVRSLEYLSSAQMAQLAAWNATDAEFPDTTLQAMFEKETAQKPDKVAVVYEQRKLTYRQLNERANRMAHQLNAEISPKPNSVIALVMDKSEHMITSILAVWKTGGAYVPIDPEYPDDRIRYILKDTCAIAVISDTCYLARIRALAGENVDLYPSDISTRPDSRWSVSNSPPSSKSTDLAYIIYTSGTTGKPKGVMVEHHGVVNLQVSLSKIFGLRETDDEVILSFSNYVFDHFVEQMTDALLNGQTLVMLNDEMRSDKERLYQYIETNRITYLSGTPSVVSMYEFSRFKDHLRRVDCVGEAFSEPVFDQIRETFQGLIINGYGPTEVSITTHKRLYPFPERRTDKSIGQQVDNSTSYVLNEDMKRVPIGAVGELYLGGEGVARGYHNRPDVTAERFIPNPFQTDEERRDGRNSRLYRTGDLVRWIPGSNGEIEYLGRNDFQVKIRGLRIELGEIEAVLSSHLDIKQSVVIAKSVKEGDQKFLVGYYVANSAVSAAAIRRFMQSRLPGYMVPSSFIPISSIPVTASGKLDTKALPAAEEEDAMNVVAPRNEIESILCGIWAELLDMPAKAIGSDSDFFSLGGDSLKSTKLSFKIHEVFNRTISVSALFRHRTIEGLAHLIMNNAGDIQEITPVDYDDGRKTAISRAQERLLFIHELEGGGNAYNIDAAFELPASVDESRVEQALYAILSRHEALRTLLPRDRTTGTFYQKILTIDEAQGMLVVEKELVGNMDQIDAIIGRLLQHVFRLDSELPWLAHILKHQTGNLYLALSFHHTCFDAWSLEIFKRELRVLCVPNGKSGNIPSLPAPQVQYKEYAEHHRRRLGENQVRKLSDFWLQRLDDLEPLQLLPDHPRPAEFNYDGDDLSVNLDGVVVESLRSIAKDHGASLSAVLLSTFCLMLSSYTNQPDIAVGVPVSHRTHPLFQSVIGFFVNMIVVRVDVKDFAVHGLIRRVMKALVDAQLHQDMPFQDVTKLLRVDNDASRHPLVQTVFNFESDMDREHETTSANQGTVRITPYQPVQGVKSVAKFDLNATVTESGSSLKINFNYATSLFRKSTIQGFLDTYKYLLLQLSALAAPGIKENTKLLLVRPEEMRDAHLPLAGSSLDSHVERLEATSLSRTFEYEASRVPERTAVIQGDRALRYAELNERANQLARYMQSVANIGSDDKVLLVLDKSIETIICILAIWKAGGAYVPLDPSYPEERVQFISETTQANVLVTQSRYASKYVSQKATVLAIDSPEVSNMVNQQSTHDLPTTTGMENLAYIIFTSGTSGKPKGVLVDQGGVLRLRDALRKRYFGAECTEYHAVLFLSNYVFDFSVEQLVLSIMSGHKLIIPEGEFIADDEFYKAANGQRLSYLSGTPSLLQQIDLARLHHLRVVTAAGEELHASQYEKLRSTFCGPIYNAYGITETTVYNIISEFTAQSKFENALRELLPGTRAYLLSPTVQPVPMDAVGELYLAGDCVARGYLNQPVLTSERFIPNPFQTGRDIAAGRYPRLYKTGDLFRCRLDRQHQPYLEYLGRADLQVKMRGYRIELSEVQNALASCPGVRECAVVAKYENNSSYSRIAKFLVGYYTPDTETVSDLSILAYMKGKLPAYMVPSQLCRLEGALPVTINGKLDVRKLPDIGSVHHQISYSPPRDVLEAKMCRLWASTLGIERCGIDDDLFRLGGDSITALHLAAQIYNQIGCKVTVRDIFDHRTIRSIHDSVLTKSAGPDSIPQFQAEQQPVLGDAPLLPIQSWFLSKSLNRPSHWNHTFYLRTPELDVTKLSTAVAELQLYHDAFQMRLRQRDGRVVQCFADLVSPAQLRVLNIKDVNGRTAIDQVLQEWQSGFDLENGPISAVAYLHGYEDRSARVWFSVHHMIIDTVSWQILARDLQNLYQGGTLGSKSSSVRQWAEAIQYYQGSASERGYWEGLLARTAASISALPPLTGTRSRLSRTWSDDKTAILLGGTLSQNVSMQDFLLAAVGLALQHLAPGSPSMVTLEGHGREETVNPTLDLSRTMGWFTSMYPFEIPPLSVDTLGQGLASLRECLNQVPARGIGFGALYGYCQHQMPQVTFNYLGQLTSKQATTDRWALAVGDGEMQYGLTTSPADKGQSSFAVDITASCVNGVLSIEVDSAWSLEESERFISKIEEGLNMIFSGALAQHTTPVLPAPEFDEEMYTPYFEHLDAPRRGPILFLLPPGEGGAESYFNNIVKHLPTTNMVVFNNYYLHTKRLNTFEKLAEMYLEQIRQIQPDGPYHFIGWSFGGTIAMEVSRQLVELGSKIGLLGIIDTYFNVPGATRALDLGDTEVLDPIHHIYQPDPADFQCLPPGTDRIVLFKATRSNDKFQSDNQRRLYEYYDKTSFNELDRLLPDTANIHLVPLVDDTHFSWATNPRQVAHICSTIEEILAKY
ncbi:N-(5-amino-5-carboxypentanoyl)-L-cysteinyl-D-valine synthase [Aspergillus foveolatus]|uniref:N-(5-amino-5-carboxypentanoyl)-L-cysteinyl-D- valine synthase n=1 Tax=Aspergillus foveolatus TaxID=210207 RepID=UPI003CCD3430